MIVKSIFLYGHNGSIRVFVRPDRVAYHSGTQITIFTSKGWIIASFMRPEPLSRFHPESVETSGCYSPLTLAEELERLGAIDMTGTKPLKLTKLTQ
jgi:hypothetical protein